MFAVFAKLLFVLKLDDQVLVLYICPTKMAKNICKIKYFYKQCHFKNNLITDLLTTGKCLMQGIMFQAYIIFLENYLFTSGLLQVNSQTEEMKTEKLWVTIFRLKICIE